MSLYNLNSSYFNIIMIDIIILLITIAISNVFRYTFEIITFFFLLNYINQTEIYRIEVC